MARDCGCFAEKTDFCGWCSKILCDQCNVMEPDEPARCYECYCRAEYGDVRLQPSEVRSESSKGRLEGQEES